MSGGHRLPCPGSAGGCIRTSSGLLMTCVHVRGVCVRVCVCVFVCLCARWECARVESAIVNASNGVSVCIAGNYPS